MNPVEKQTAPCSPSGHLLKLLVATRSITGSERERACASRVKANKFSLSLLYQWSPVSSRMRQIHAVLNQRVVRTLRLYALPHRSQHPVETPVECSEMWARKHRKGGIVGCGLLHR